MPANTKTETAAPAAETPKDIEAYMNEEVTVHLFKDNGNYKDDVFVAVNGVGVQIQRGVDVKIKRKYAEVLKRSMEQDYHTADLIERESGRFIEEAKERKFNL